MTEKDDVGDWNEVGYTGPGTRVNSGDYKSANFEYTGAKGTWEATNLVKLNECKINSKAWILTATPVKASSNTQGQSGMKLVATAQTGDLALCTGLTPSFSTLADNFK